MAITISEKDGLFIIINFTAFLAWVSYMILDFVVALAQMMAAADPQYANIEVGIAILRSIALMAMVVLGLSVMACDLWWGYRLWRSECKSYWRENL